MVEGRGSDSVAGIGADLAGKIKEIVDTGRCKVLDDAQALPPAIVELLRIPGLGPKRVSAVPRTRYSNPRAAEARGT